MTSVRRRGLSRLAATVLAPGLLVAGAMAAAGPATADEQQARPGGATATLDGLKTYSHALIKNRDGQKKVGAGLFEMTVDGGGTLQTYCIDIANPTMDRARYEEVSWDASSLNGNNEAGKILWILQHSYPQVDDLDALAGAAGTGKLSPRTAAAGTQVAIWRFSDRANVTAVDPEAEKLADYLQATAENVAEPKASLQLAPHAVSGKSGERLGPVTVSTNGQSVTVAPSAGAATAGVKIVDKDGNPVATSANGGELYFDVPKGTEPGSAALTVQASTKVPVGRAFTSAGGHKSQTQILAGSSESTVSASATATWAKQGAVAAVSAEKNCAKGGVDVTVTNEGDEVFTYTLAGERREVAAGGTETVTVPAREDASYSITVTGSNGFEQTFTGVLDCETAATGGDDEGTSPQTGTDETSDDGADLAETGGNSNTPMIVGVALALVVAGGATMLLVRRRKPSTGTSGSND